MDSHQHKRRCLENTSTAQEVDNSVLRKSLAQHRVVNFLESCKNIW